MLPPFIIEQIRKREEEERHRRHEPPVLELPLQPEAPEEGPRGGEDETERGVVIIDLKDR
jgi:hypothetical protein